MTEIWHLRLIRHDNLALGRNIPRYRPLRRTLRKNCDPLANSETLGMFDAEDSNNQLFLTRTFQSLASVKTRRILELLAQGPRGGSELLQVVDSTETRIRESMQALQMVRLVSEGESRKGTVYRLDHAGLDLARSWLDRVDAIAGIRGEK
jgi:hypothetical protein